jgi:hypothetical protein
MSAAVPLAAATDVILAGDFGAGGIEALLGRYGIEAVLLNSAAAIPGSYWGGAEAGLVGSRLYWRADTPVHSILHEASHFICMSEARRARLERDAGGDHAEENAVCYLQILLADELGAGMSRQRMWRDMDAWGYSFRLGSAQAWFEGDAADARAWLIEQGVIDPGLTDTGGCVTWRKRLT